MSSTSKTVSRITSRTALSFDTLDTLWVEVEGILSEPEPAGLRGMRSGFDTLDELLRGVRGVLVIGGMPGVGKTALAMDMSWGMASRRVAVIYQSIEMSRRALLERITARLQSELLSPEELKDQYETVGSHILLEDAGSITPTDELGERLNALIAARDAKGGLVVVDSIQALANRESMAPTESHKHVIDKLMTKLHHASAEEGTAMLVLSQLPKSAMNYAGAFSFSGSGGIDHLADATAILEDPMEASSTDDHERSLLLTLHKNRYGPLGNVPLLFYPASMRFEERR